jgi:hypothetical protein
MHFLTQKGMLRIALYQRACGAAVPWRWAMVDCF